MENRDYAKECGNRCRIIRQAKGLTLQQLSEKMNVSYAAISKWEKEGITNINHIMKLSDVLGQDITADQVDQEGSVGEVGKEILRILVENNGNADYKDILLKLYGMKSDRFSNELFKLQRIGAIIREQYVDFGNQDRDVVFITAKGVIVYKNAAFINADLPGVKTYDMIVPSDKTSYQDVINDDKVTALFMQLDNSGLSYRCDYLKYLCDNYFKSKETGNVVNAMVYSYPECADYMGGINCYHDIINKMVQGTNRVEFDEVLKEGLDIWGKDWTEYRRHLVENALNMERIEIDTVDTIYGNYFIGVEYRFDEKKIADECVNNIFADSIDLDERVANFLKNLPEDIQFDCSKWFTEDEIRDFIETNILEAANETERHIDNIIHQIWEADKSTLDYYYSFPTSWEENGLAQLVRDRVGVPTR